MEKIEAWSPYIQIILSLFSTIALAVVGYLLVHVQALEVDIAVIKGNRFTAQDGVELERRLIRSHTDLQNKMVKQDEQLISIHKSLIENPPKWLTDDVKTIRVTLEKILDKLSALEIRIQRNEDRINQHHSKPPREPGG